MYSSNVWHQHSDLVTPHKETSRSAQQGVGSDNTNFSSWGRKTQSLQVDAEWTWAAAVEASHIIAFR